LPFLPLKKQHNPVSQERRRINHNRTSCHRKTTQSRFLPETFQLNCPFSMNDKGAEDKSFPITLWISLFGNNGMTSFAENNSFPYKP
jgi:hypothetical protein